MTSGKDGVRLLRIGDDVVLCIEVYPTMFMLALDPESAVSLAEGLLEIAMKPEEVAEVEKNVDHLLKGLRKKDKGEPS